MGWDGWMDGCGAVGPSHGLSSAYRSICIEKYLHIYTRIRTHTSACASVQGVRPAGLRPSSSPAAGATAVTSKDHRVKDAEAGGEGAHGATKEVTHQDLPSLDRGRTTTEATKRAAAAPAAKGASAADDDDDDVFVSERVAPTKAADAGSELRRTAARTVLLDRTTVPELKALCKSVGFSGYSKLKKAGLSVGSRQAGRPHATTISPRPTRRLKRRA
jgi:hypothetical protein